MLIDIVKDAAVEAELVQHHQLESQLSTVSTLVILPNRVFTRGEWHRIMDAGMARWVLDQRNKGADGNI
jgi:hypothetical protein